MQQYLSIISETLAFLQSRSRGTSSSPRAGIVRVGYASLFSSTISFSVRFFAESHTSDAA